MEEITREEIRSRLNDPTLRIVNVLPRTAFEEFRIPGSVSLPVAEIRSRARDVLPNLSADIAVYCGKFD